MAEMQKQRLQKLVRQAATMSAGAAAMGVGIGSAQAVVTTGTFHETVVDTDPGVSTQTELEVDLDGDGTTDLGLTHQYTDNGTFVGYSAFAGGRNGTNVFHHPLGAEVFVIRYAAGDAIDGSDDAGNYFFKSLAGSSSLGGVPQPEGGDFRGAGATGGYLGFALATGALGWLQVDVAPVTDANPHKITFGEWAFAGPGEGIIAGTLETFALGTPEPTTAALGGLAVLAVGAAAVRRRR